MALIGLPGSGKSSVGRLLSNALKYDFVDLDERIVQRTGKSISEIFAANGESGFRQIETTTLANLGSPNDGKRIILSTGGGIILTEKCRELLQESWYTIYLKASVQTLTVRLSNERDGRPLLNGEESLSNRLHRLEQERRAYYEQTSHVTIAVDDKTVAEVVQCILDSASPIMSDQQRNGG